MELSINAVGSGVEHCSTSFQWTKLRSLCWTSFVRPTNGCDSKYMFKVAYHCACVKFPLRCMDVLSGESILGDLLYMYQPQGLVFKVQYLT